MVLIAIFCATVLVLGLMVLAGRAFSQSEASQIMSHVYSPPADLSRSGQD